MMAWHYILVDKEPRVVVDLIEWAKWFETADRVVRQTTLPNTIKVSTIFLGIDHGFPVRMEENHVPILFETMIFGGKYDHYQYRHATWADAVEGHNRCIAMVEHESVTYAPLKLNDVEEIKKLSKN